MEAIKVILGLLLLLFIAAQAEKWKAADALPLDQVQFSVTLVHSLA
jgi:hypothetical protein